MSDQGTIVALSPDEALERAVVYMTPKGASVVGRTENTISFTYRKGPNPVLLILLLLLILIPGIYLLGGSFQKRVLQHYSNACNGWEPGDLRR
jgi:hypothetical protein